MSFLTTISNAANQVTDFLKDNKQTIANVATGVASAINPTLGTFVGALTGAQNAVQPSANNFQAPTGNQYFQQQQQQQQQNSMSESKFMKWLNGVKPDGTKRKWYATGWAVLGYTVIGISTVIWIIVKKPFSKGFKRAKKF